MSRIFLIGVYLVANFLGSHLCYAASAKQQSYTEILFHSDKDRVLASILQTPTGGTISGRSEYILYLSSPLNTQYIYEVSTDDELGINARRLHELMIFDYITPPDEFASDSVTNIRISPLEVP
jgi:hypothetical protein